MYEISANETMRELEVGRVAREKVLQSNDLLVSRFLGVGREELTEVRQNPSMHEYSFITLHLPKLAFRAPRTIATSSREQMFGQWAEALERALNRVSRDHDDETLSMLLAQAFFFSHGVAVTVPKPLEGESPTEGTGPWLPTSEFLNQDRFLIDPRCSHQNSSFWEAHLWTMDKDELVDLAENEGEDLGWDIDAVRALDTKTLNEHSELHALDLERNEVAGYQVWFRGNYHDEDVGPEDGYNGTTVWVTPGGSERDSGAVAKLLRAPQPFYGPDTGPYQMFGYLPIPKSPYFLSPLAATQADSDRLNMVMRETDRAMGEYKRMIGLPQGIKDKKNFPSGTTFEIAGMDPASYKPVVVELGGVTEHMLGLEGLARKRLEITASMDSAQHGQVTGKGTATENALVDAVTQTRSAYQKSRYLKGWSGLQRKRSFYLVLDNRVVIPGVGEGGNETYLGGDGMGTARGQLPTGLRPGEFHVQDPVGNEQGFDLLKSLEIDTDTMSTEQTSEPMHKRNVMMLIQMYVSWLPTIMQAPGAPWEAWMIAAAEANNVPDLASEFDIEKFLQTAGIPAGTSPAAGAPSELQPHLQDGARAARGVPLVGSLVAPSVGAV